MFWCWYIASPFKWLFICNNYLWPWTGVALCKRSSSSLFHVWKLSCYNASIYNLGSKDGFLYPWNEMLSKRGANKIESCIKHFANNVLDATTDLVIWQTLAEAKIEIGTLLLWWCISLKTNQTTPIELHWSISSQGILSVRMTQSTPVWNQQCDDPVYDAASCSSERIINPNLFLDSDGQAARA